MTGNFTPFVKLYGKYFTMKDEPQSWQDNFDKMYQNYFNGKKYKIKPLNYFYDLEKESRRELKRIQAIEQFINEDPFFKDDIITFNMTKKNVRVIKLKINKKKNKSNDEKKRKKIKVRKIKI